MNVHYVINTYTKTCDREAVSSDCIVIVLITESIPFERKKTSNFCRIYMINSRQPFTSSDPTFFQRSILVGF